MRRNIGPGINGWPTWTLNPDKIIRNPIHYRWAAQHLTHTPTGIAFIQLPPAHAGDFYAFTPPYRATINADNPEPYLYIEADPDEETNTWECRTWWNHHPRYTHPDDYLLALTIHAATTPPQQHHTIEPIRENTNAWNSTWVAHTSKGPPPPVLMTLWQFYEYAHNQYLKLTKTAEQASLTR